MTGPGIRKRPTDLVRVFFIAWAVLLLAGTLGEVLDITWLREVTDLKRIFLR